MISILLGALLVLAPMAASQSSVDPMATVPVSGHLTGVASWYRWRPGEAAAGSSLRAFLGPRWRGMSVQVCALQRCVVVKLTDWCGCLGTRIIDLDRASFAMLANPSRGLLKVVVSRA